LALLLLPGRQQVVQTVLAHCGFSSSKRSRLLKVVRQVRRVRRPTTGLLPNKPQAGRVPAVTDTAACLRGVSTGVSDIGGLGRCQKGEGSDWRQSPVG
jgi:hypothetical protein